METSVLPVICREFESYRRDATAGCALDDPDTPVLLLRCFERSYPTFLTREHLSLCSPITLRLTSLHSRFMQPQPSDATLCLEKKMNHWMLPFAIERLVCFESENFREIVSPEPAIH